MADQVKSNADRLDELTALVDHLVRQGDKTNAQRLDDVIHLVQTLHRKVDRINRKENMLMGKAEDISAALDTVQADAASETDLIKAVAGVTDGLVAQVSDLQAKLDAAIASGADPKTLQDISDKMGVLTSTIDSNKLAIAAITGTPAAPAALQGGRRGG